MKLDGRDRRIVALAVPALATLAIEPLYVLVDTAIVGRLGTVPLGGLALASTVLASVVWVFNFLAYGTTARVAFLSGRGDERGGATVAVQGLWLCGAIGLPLAVAVVLGARPMVRLLGGEGAVLEAAVTYLRISSIGIPAVMVALVGNGYLRGRADTRSPLIVVLVANVVNVILDVVLVYGLDQGLAGSAWGTVVAQWMAAVWFLSLLGSPLAATGAGLMPVGREMGRLMVAGRRLFVRTGALLVTLALATAAAARVDAATLAGHQIALQIHLFLALVLDSLAIPGQIFVGTALGRGDADEARGMAGRLLRLGIVLGVAVGGVVLLFDAVGLPRLFTSDPDVVDRAQVALVFVALAQVPSAVAFVLDGVLMGAADFAFLQASMIAGLAVFVPVAVAILWWPGLGIAGLWAGLVAWMLARATANALRFRGNAWVRVVQA